VAYLPRSTGGRGKIQQRPDPHPVQPLPLNQTGIFTSLGIQLLAPRAAKVQLMYRHVVWHRLLARVF
jgi:hypothetical protein